MFEWWDVVWPWLLGAINVCLAVAATVHVVLRKRDTRASIGWVGLVWLTPMLGTVLYFCFGINRIQRRALSLKVRQAWLHQADVVLTADEAGSREQIVAREPQLVGLATLVQSLTDRPLLPGNRVEPLINGDEAYPAMLEAIDSAEQSVSLLSYIFDCDRAGNAFCDALQRAQQRGVEVRVLIDDVGSQYSRPRSIKQLQALGVNAAAFLPTRVPRLFAYANLRNHRKIMVVDGKLGFTGGTNIREGHWLGLQPRTPVQCVHFRVEGPVVQQLQEVFALDWAFATDESLHGRRWFPDLEKAGNVWARGIPDGPDEDLNKLTHAMLGALATARRSVRIVTPYFLPDLPLVHMLAVTAMRGVDVRIVIPAKNNIPVVKWAGASLYAAMLEKGCRIFESAPPFDHTKLLVIDGIWSLIGSSNWDARSLRLNFEFNLECYDAELVGHLDELIDEKLAVAKELSLEQLEARKPWIKLRDGLAALTTPYL